MKPVILSISPLDSSGGAGVMQESTVAALHDCFLINCNTGITIQTKKGLIELHSVPDSFFSKMLNLMIEDYPVKVCKIGALCSISQINIIMETLNHYIELPVVWDPVIKPTGGQAFLPDATLSDYLNLLQRVNYLLPNLSELSFLSCKHLNNFQEAINAAEQLCKTYHIGIMIKGGHLSGKNIKEAWITEYNRYYLSKPRHNWNYTHGTGCALSTSFACNIAKGIPPQIAYRKSTFWLNKYYNKLQDIEF